jgi:hypothetical protein
MAVTGIDTKRDEEATQPFDLLSALRGIIVDPLRQELGQTGRDIQQLGVPGALASRAGREFMTLAGAPAAVDRLIGTPLGLPGGLLAQSLLGNLALAGEGQQQQPQQQGAGIPSNALTDAALAQQLGMPIDAQLNAIFGTPTREQGQGGRTQFDLGEIPQIGPIPAPRQAQAPDFSGAVAALGAPPTEPQRIEQSEKLARFLGAAAGGSLAGGGPGRAANVGETLAGAGAGGAGSIARVAKEERDRVSEFNQRRDTFNARAADIQLRAARAKSETERFNLAQEMETNRMNFRREFANAQLRAPKYSQSQGIVSISKAEPDPNHPGKFMGTVETVDILEPIRLAEQQIKLAAARGKLQVLDGLTATDASTFDPQVAQLMSEATTLIKTGAVWEDPQLREFIEPFYEEMTGGRSLDEFSAGILSLGDDPDTAHKILQRATIKGMLAMMAAQQGGGQPQGGQLR